MSTMSTAPITGSSVRDLIVELTDIENTRRQCVSEDSSMCDRGLLATREGHIIAELRSRRRAWRRTVAG